MTKTSHAYMISHIRHTSLNNTVDMYNVIFHTRYEIHV